MRDEVPAAAPLIVLIVALAASPWIAAILPCAGGLMLIGAALAFIRRFRLAMLAVAAATGLLVGASEVERYAAERRTFRAHDSDRFVRARVALERDWSNRGHYHALRSPRFEIDGHQIATPMTLYARFEPPLIHLEESAIVEGRLRYDERGRYTMSIKSPRLLHYEGAMSMLSPKAWNRAIANRLRRHAADHPREIAMIEALVLGRGERLSDQTREEFKRGGTYHLLVFSGLQISIAAAAIALLLRWAGAPRASDFSLLAFALVAPPFIGASASVSRASTGIALYAISRILRRPTSFENLWCVAAMARLLIAPTDLTDPGFHLTYAGAGALLFIGKPLARTRVRWIAYAIAAEVAIAPLTLFHFHQYALGGSIATIAMTPVVFTMLVIGIVFCATQWTPLLQLIALLNSACASLNNFVSPASGFFTAPSTTSMVAGSLGALIAIAALRGRWRTVALIGALLIPTATAFLIARSQSSVTEPTITFFDVGQGDAGLIRAGAHNILVDGGGRIDDARFGESILLPMLVDRGVLRLDIVVLTHAHPDHCGGLSAVLDQLEVGELWINPRRFRGECAHRMLIAAADANVPIRLVRHDVRRTVGAIAIHAYTADQKFKRSPENNSSIVLRVVANGRSALLTGDIERDAEASLTFEPADVLKVPHHASRTSASGFLLDAARPRIAVISCGRRNVFGHPHPDVLAALAQRSATVWRTDRSGTISVQLTKTTIRVTPQIDTAP